MRRPEGVARGERAIWKKRFHIKGNSKCKGLEMQADLSV